MEDWLIFWKTRNYQVDICDAAQDEKDLDWGVVPRYEVEEEIDVSWKEDQEIQDLSFSRNSFAWLGGNDFDKYCEDGSIVGYVAHHTKQIHPHFIGYFLSSSSHRPAWSQPPVWQHCQFSADGIRVREGREVVVFLIPPLQLELHPLQIKWIFNDWMTWRAGVWYRNLIYNIV